MQNYLFGHIALIALSYLRDTCGWMEIQTKEQALDVLKEQLGLYDKSGDEKIVLSTRTVNIDRLQKFTEASYIFLLQNGCNVEHPENYKNG